MTFEELDSRFPNGFVDAEITGLSIDYSTRTARFQVNLRTNPPESPERDVYSGAVLETYNTYFLSIEPPDIGHSRGTERKKITVDGLPEDIDSFPLFKQFGSIAPEGAFFCRFFVHDWNSFIHVGAASAAFRLLSDESDGQQVKDDRHSTRPFV